MTVSYVVGFYVWKNSIPFIFACASRLILVSDELEQLFCQKGFGSSKGLTSIKYFRFNDTGVC